MKSNEIKPLVWNNERVLTTKQIAEAYGCKEKQIRQNFNNHKDRYKEGKHYYTLKGSDLKFFKDYVNSMEYVDNIDLVDKRAPHTTIYTKKGAFMAAKLIDTDKAWDMYEQLVDHYFTVNDAVNKPALPSDRSMTFRRKSHPCSKHWPRLKMYRDMKHKQRSYSHRLHPYRMSFSFFPATMPLSQEQKGILTVSQPGEIPCIKG